MGLCVLRFLEGVLCLSMFMVYRRIVVSVRNFVEELGMDSMMALEGPQETDAQDAGSRGIDVGNETLLSLTEAAKQVPKLNGRRVHASTIFRWCRRGLNDIRLEYVRVGRRIATSAEALNRFFNALAAADGDAPAHRHARTTELSPSRAARAHDIARAEAKLEEAGL